MKKLLLLLGAVLQFAFTAPAHALPCGTQSLADYIGLGIGGCTIGDATFNNFAEVTPLSPGATQIAAAGIFLTPFSGASGIGFSLSSGTPLTAAGSDLLELFFGFNVSAGPGNPFTANTIVLDASASATGNAAITIVEDNCVEGTFATPVENCSSANSFSQTVIAIDGLSILEQSMVLAPFSTFFDVFVDLVVDGGIDGLALLGPTLGEFRLTTVAQVPEPQSLLLAVTALMAIAGSRRFRRCAPRA